MRANDWVYAFRGLRRSPRFTFAAALTLALGIGANTAIFSFIDAIYLRPLPYPDAKRLVTLAEKDAKGRVRGASAASYLDWRHDAAFTAVGAWNLDVVTLSGGPWPERVQALRIGGDYLSALGVTPAMGRGFTADDERPNSDCAVMVSARFWRKWFGAGVAIGDRPIKLDGAPCAVVGMMPESFVPPLTSGMRVDAWLPLRLDPARIVDPKDRSVQVVAHLAPGVTVEAVRGRIDGAASLQTRVTGTPNRALLTLAAAVGFLLLIACLNVATLVRARAAAERRQIAIRAALGASRAQLIAHQLAGTLLLAFLGGLGGLLAAYASLDALVAMAQGTLPRSTKSISTGASSPSPPPFRSPAASPSASDPPSESPAPISARPSLSVPDGASSATPRSPSRSRSPSSSSPAPASSSAASTRSAPSTSASAPSTSSPPTSPFPRAATRLPATTSSTSTPCSRRSAPSPASSPPP